MKKIARFIYLTLSVSLKVMWSSWDSNLHLESAVRHYRVRYEAGKYQDTLTPYLNP